MSVAPPDDNFFSEFLDDFFAECDEHISAIRRDLLVLESTPEESRPDQTLLETLFRSFHSLKGLAGMVGAATVEQLAHQVESYFRALRQGEVQLTPQALDLLLAGASLLPQLLDAWHAKQPPPPTASLLDGFERLLQPVAEPTLEATAEAMPEATPEATPEAEAMPPETTELMIAAVPAVWLFEFVPTPGLTARGINVNVIRNRLQTLGEIRQATPVVRAAGGVAFHFVVATTAEETVFAPWAADGLQWTPEAPTPALATTAAPAPGAGSSGSNVVRVDLRRLDTLMQMIGDLVIMRSRLEDRLGRLEQKLTINDWRELQEVNAGLTRQLRDLREAVVRARMVPVGEVFARMQFAVHELARQSNKQVQLELEGQQTEIDKYVVDRLADPLLHLVRNAVSHGLELPAERLAQGKPAAGVLRLSATVNGDMATITLRDDGRGIDTQVVAARARELRLWGDAPLLESEQLLHILTTPGFSTRTTADRHSGRGVGMDVVRQTVEALGGTLALTTKVGAGSQFTIQLPLTLTIVDALTVVIGGHLFAIPLPLIQEVIEVTQAAHTALEQHELLRVRDQVLPLVHPARLFGLPSAVLPPYALLVGHGGGATAFAVERVLSKREIVVRPINDPLIEVRGISGATELGDGRAVLIVDLPALSYPEPTSVPLRTLGPSGALQPSQQSGTQPMIEPYIVLEVAGTSYAVRSVEVQQIEMIDQITPVPNAPSALDGVVFARGQLVPVLNLRARFGLPRIANDVRTRLVVVRNDGRTIGLLVDSAREFVRIDSTILQPAPEALSRQQGNYVEQIAPLSAERVVLILNVAEVVHIALPALPALPAL